jgi:PAS domain S-box-containing protein
LSALVDSLPLAMFCKDYKEEVGVFIGWNKAAEELWGLDLSEILGKSDFDLFPHDQAELFRKKDQETLASMKQTFVDEEPVDSPSVGTRYVRTWKVPICDRSGSPRYILGISQDISDERALRKTLKVQELAAIQVSKMASLGEMAGGIAHEINNPLSIIKGQASLLDKISNKQMTNESTVKMEKSLSIIHGTIDRIKAIVDSLKKFSRDGSTEAFRSEDASSIVQESLALCGQRFEHLGIDIKVVPSSSPITVMCRSIQLSQVLINLLNNARKAVENLPSGQKWIKVEWTQVQENLQIKIIDSGPGVDQKHVERIFEPFYTTYPVGSGTGLGLSISQGLIATHGGRIFLDESHENTCFVIEFPIKPQEKETAA